MKMQRWLLRPPLLPDFTTYSLCVVTFVWPNYGLCYRLFIFVFFCGVILSRMMSSSPPLWCLSWEERAHLTCHLSGIVKWKVRVYGKVPGMDCASLISAEDRGAGLGVQQSAAPLVKQHMLYLYLFIGMLCPFQSVMETFVFQVHGKASVEVKTFLQFKAETHQQQESPARHRKPTF